jgi:hypothetical protein
MKVGGGERLGGAGLAVAGFGFALGFGAGFGGAGLGLEAGLGAGFALLAVIWRAGEVGMASRFLGGISNLADLEGDLAGGDFEFLTGDLPFATGFLFGVKALAF